MLSFPILVAGLRQTAARDKSGHPEVQNSIHGTHRLALIDGYKPVVNYIF